MIDKDKIKHFWESRGQKYQEITLESISNLEEDPDLFKLKVDLERKLVFSKLKLNKNQSVLDLGAGVGQWSFRFSPHVKNITAVEFAKSQVDIALLEINKRGINNIEYVLSSAEEFESDKRFDLIFISGLFVFLNDNQANQLLQKTQKWLNTDGVLFVRDGTSILNHRYYIQDQYSNLLKTNYSAIYRTREEYLDLFQLYDYHLIEDNQVFKEGIPLNKYSETRLRYYYLKRNK